MNKRQQARKHRRRQAHGVKAKVPTTFNMPEGSTIRFLDEDTHDWAPHKFKPTPPVIQTINGPVGETELNSMTVPDLKDMATMMGVDFKARDRKSTLIDKLLGRHS